MLWHFPAMSHKTHHEHDHPSVLTNQHFTIADLFVEAYFPAIVAMAVLVKGLCVHKQSLSLSLSLSLSHATLLLLVVAEAMRDRRLVLAVESQCRRWRSP